jgi:hypothetical protein
MSLIGTCTYHEAAGFSLNAAGNTFERVVASPLTLQQLCSDYGGLWRIAPDVGTLESSGDDFFVFQRADAPPGSPMTAWPVLFPSYTSTDIINGLYAEGKAALHEGSVILPSMDYAAKLLGILLATFPAASADPTVALVPPESHVSVELDEIAWTPLEFTIPAYELTHAGFKLMKTTKEDIQLLQDRYHGLLLIASSLQDVADSVRIPLLSFETASLVWYRGKERPYPADTHLLQPNTSHAFELYHALGRWGADQRAGTSKELAKYFGMCKDAVKNCQNAAQNLHSHTTTAATAAVGAYVT